MSAEAWALSWRRPWDTALDRLQEDLDRVELHLAGAVGTAAVGAGGEDAGGEGPRSTAPGFLSAQGFPPVVQGNLPEHLGERARGLLARTDELVLRVTGELSRTAGELREVAGRVPEAATVTRRAHRHPAFLDTRA